jgi:hypothetical protein
MASGPVFMFCASQLVFGGTEGVGSYFHVWSRFHVKRSRIRFRRYRGRWVSFSCFARPDSFSMVLRAMGAVFMFSAPGLIFDGIEGVGSRFHVLRSRTRFRRYRGRRSRFHVLRARTHFQRYRGRRVPFSCFVRPDSFSAVSRASGPVFKVCAPGLIFSGGAECIGSRSHVLRAPTHFRQYRGRRVPFSCFALPDSFSAVPSASGPVFTFCAPGLVFGGTEGAGPVFMFCALRLIFGGTECVGSRFHVLRVLTRF